MQGSKGDAEIGKRLWSQWETERVGCLEKKMQSAVLKHKWITICNIYSQWGFAVRMHGTQSPVICDSSEEWDGKGDGGRFERERTHVCQ